MSIRINKVTVCCLCWNEHKYTWYSSYYLRWPIELDASWWIYSCLFSVMRCKCCWYCSGDLADVIKWAKEIINIEEYKKQLDNQENPEYVNTLLCYSMLCEKVEDYFKCGFNNLEVAWQFDYKDIPEKYIEYRLKALSFFEKDIQKLYELSDNDWTWKIIHIDLLRRTRQFDKAMKVLNEIKETIFAEDIIKILNIENRLIINMDDGRYDIDWNKVNNTEFEFNKQEEQYNKQRDEQILALDKNKNESILSKIIKKIIWKS